MKKNLSSRVRNARFLRGKEKQEILKNHELLCKPVDSNSTADKTPARNK